MYSRERLIAWERNTAVFISSDCNRGIHNFELKFTKNLLKNLQFILCFWVDLVYFKSDFMINVTCHHLGLLESKDLLL